jgi:hypothetical protein
MSEQLPASGAIQPEGLPDSINRLPELSVVEPLGSGALLGVIGDVDVSYLAQAPSPKIIEAKDMPGYEEWSSKRSAERPLEAVAVIKAMPGYIKPQKRPTARPPRYIIDSVPEQKEFDLNYSGEEGEYVDANRLLAELSTIDPHGEFSDDVSRKEKLLSMNIEEFKNFVQSIHTAIYPAASHEFADREAILSGGSGDERRVSTIGIGPEDREELLNDLLDSMKTLVGKNDLYGAGLMTAQTLVAMQPFADGNKRTSRAVYELIAYGFDGSHYDVHGIRERLAYTQAARNSMYYVGITSSLRIPYAMEGMSNDQRRDYKILADYSFSLMKRPLLMGALSHLGDEKLAGQISDTLQQSGFGAQYMFEHIKPEVIEKYRDTYDKGLFEAAVTEYCQQLTPDSARALLVRDKANRKQCMKRILKSSTGEDPLPYYSSATGEALNDSVVSLAAA